MSRIYKLIILNVLVGLLFACSSTKQIGKFYEPEEANKLFGNVIYSVDLNTNVLSGLLKKTNNIIMFGIINRELIILDNNRGIIFPEKAEIKDTDVFTVYSTDLLIELISNNKSNSQSNNVTVEQRSEVLSISTDKATLETGGKCPPFCAE